MTVGLADRTSGLGTRGARDHYADPRGPIRPTTRADAARTRRDTTRHRTSHGTSHDTSDKAGRRTKATQRDNPGLGKGAFGKKERESGERRLYFFYFSLR